MPLANIAKWSILNLFMSPRYTSILQRMNISKKTWSVYIDKNFPKVENMFNVNINLMNIHCSGALFVNFEISSLLILCLYCWIGLHKKWCALWVYIYSNSTIKILNNTWDKVFKNGTSKICGRQPLKNLKGYGLLKFSCLYCWLWSVISPTVYWKISCKIPIRRDLSRITISRYK